MLKYFEAATLKPVIQSKRKNSSKYFKNLRCKMPDNAQYVVIFVTVSSNAEAEHIAKHLLTHKKAAGVSVVPNINSSFWWNR